jgi:multidrug efflux pump subunit AcrA (membrane-fusion protein)
MLITSLLLSALAGQAILAAEIVPVEVIQLQGKVVLGGTVIPYKEVTLAAQIPGRIEYLAGDVGDKFKSGDLLVAVDIKALQAKRRSVLAKIAQADAVLRNAYVQYKRELIAPRSRSITATPGMGVPKMFDNIFTKNMAGFMGGDSGHPGLERHADVYRSYSGINQAQAQLMQARSALEEVDAKIRDSRSIAPFDGVILAKLIEVGDTVQPGQPLVKFGHVKYLRIQVDVPARLVRYLRIGQFVPAYIDTARTKVDARVAQIYPLADPTQHTVTVKFDLPTWVPGGPGMYAEVMVPDGEAEGVPTVVIPKSALIRAGSLPGVLVVKDGNTSELRLIRLGSDFGQAKVIVLSGLQPDERVIDHPPPGVSSGWMPGEPGSAP